VVGALLLNIIFAGSVALVATIVGWLLRASANSDADSPSPSETNAPTTDIAVVEGMLAHLHQLTESVAADVGEHNSRMQEINLELTDSSTEDPDVIAIVEQLLKANETMQTQLVDAEERLQEQAIEMQSHVKEARTDALTHLFNRRAFDDEMAKLETTFMERSQPSCVMMIDVDHFKRFNDTHGHLAGDEVLRGVARVLRKNLGSKEIVCRYGGEEFSVLFPGSDIQTAIPAAERAREAITNEVFRFEGKELKVTASGGLAQLAVGKTGEEVVKQSDDALYVCKESGRDCGFWHDGESTHRMTLDDKSAELGEEFKVAVSGPVEDRRDQIVGVSTREAFLADVGRRVAEYRRGGATVSILLVEIDEFEALQETAGPRTSQLVLRATAQFLKATMGDMDHITRFGDHQFALLLPGAGISDVTSIAERLRAAVSNTDLPFNGGSHQYTISLGAAEALGIQDRAGLVERGQQSLKAAQDAGGNQCFVMTDENDCRPMTL
jgi:diguanylate cyclase